MGKRKPTKETTPQVYARIRKPVPPPPRVEQDRRKNLLEALRKREAERDANPEDE